MGWIRSRLPSDPPASPFPLSVSASGRYLQASDGSPFLINGECIWNLIVQGTLAKVDTYLADRVARGVSAVLVQLIGTMGDNPPRADGAAGTPQPFTTPGNFTTPNAAYFAHAKTVINKCHDAGVVVLLDALYPGFEGAPAGQGWISQLNAASTGDITTYGNYLRAEFADCPNIIWVLGGDNSGNLPKMEALGAALTDGATRLVTAHWGGTTISSSMFASQPGLASIINVNAVYDWNHTSTLSADAYTADQGPAFLIETHFYDTEFTTLTRQYERELAYDAWLSGATAGVISGRMKIWQMGSAFAGFSSSAPDDWEAALGATNDNALLPFKELCTGRAWHELVPDYGSGFITSGRGTLGTAGYVAAAKTADSTLAIAYVPGGGARTIDLTQMAGNGLVTAVWQDPTSGDEFPCTGSPLAQGSHAFDAATERGNNAEGSGNPDWLLVLSVAA